MRTIAIPHGGTTVNNRIHPGRVMARLALVLAVALLAAACSGGSGSGLKLTDPWARTSPMVAGAGAAYMVIENSGTAADALLGGKSDVAKAVEVHETYELASAAPMASEMPAESSDMGGTESPVASGMPVPSLGTGAMMGMRKIDKLEIPAGGKVELKPGGYHILLIELTRELKVGDKVEITLTFEKAGDVKVTAEVRAQ